MSVLTVEKVGHTFGDRTLFSDVSFRLLEGEHIGLVGANGVGKSTLMSILTGELIHDEGKVEWQPGTHYGYLDQHTKLTPGRSMRETLQDAFLPLYKKEEELNNITSKMADATPEELEQLLEEMAQAQDELDAGDFYTLDKKIEEVARGLGLEAVGLDRDVSSLSGGQRTKVLLAKLLLEKPKVLLLDEPTNYLDVEHIHWLSMYLNDYPHAFLLISHDSTFMNGIVDIILHLEFSKMNRYTASFDKFLELAEQSKKQHLDAYEKQQESIKKEETFIAKNKARASTTGRAKSRQKQLDKIERIDRPESAVKPSFDFKESRSSSRFVLEAEELEIGYEQPRLPKIDVTIERGQKIAVVGYNGVGKSTLLKLLRKYFSPQNGDVFVDGMPLKDIIKTSYFSHISNVEQQVFLFEDTIRNNITLYKDYSDEEVYAAINQAGLRDFLVPHPQGLETMIYDNGKNISGGEKSRIAIARGLLHKADIIFLDEAFASLDSTVAKEIENTILRLEGITVINVSHVVFEESKDRYHDIFMVKEQNVYSIGGAKTT